MAGVMRCLRRAALESGALRQSRAVLPTAPGAGCACATHVRPSYGTARCAPCDAQSQALPRHGVHPRRGADGRLRRDPRRAGARRVAQRAAGASLWPVYARGLPRVPCSAASLRCSRAHRARRRVARGRFHTPACAHAPQRPTSARRASLLGRIQSLHAPLRGRLPFTRRMRSAPPAQRQLATAACGGGVPPSRCRAPPPVLAVRSRATPGRR